jgi:hypothetical protein
MLSQFDTTLAAVGTRCARATGSGVERMPLSVRAPHRSPSVPQTHAATAHPTDAFSGQVMRQRPAAA